MTETSSYRGLFFKNLTQKQQRTHDLTGLPMLRIVILK